MALEVAPDNDKFEILNIVGARVARERFDVGTVEQRLGFKFVYDFANYE